MTPALVLIQRLRALLADPAKWTKKAGARDKEGRSVIPESKEAVCWCMRGGLSKVAAEAGCYFDLSGISVDSIPEATANDHLTVFSTLVNVTRTCHGLNLAAFNDLDKTTHADVLATLYLAEQELGRT